MEVLNRVPEKLLWQRGPNWEVTSAPGGSKGKMGRVGCLQNSEHCNKRNQESPSCLFAGIVLSSTNWAALSTGTHCAMVLGG